MQSQTDRQKLVDFPTARGIASSGTTPSLGLLEFGKELIRYLPNRVVIAIVCIGFLTEMLALSQMQQPLFRLGWRVTVVTTMFVAWFWLTLGLLLHRTSAKLLSAKSETSSTRSIVTYSTHFIMFAVFVGMYATSWGLFLKTSRFANWEVLRFSFQNVAELSKYVHAAEPLHLFYGAMVLIAGSVLLWMSLKPLSAVKHRNADCPLPANRLWFLATTLTLSALAVVQHSSTADVAQRDLLALKHGLNPIVTLVGTGIESVLLDPIEQVFADPEVELTPLSESWSPEIVNWQTTNELPSIIMIQVESLRSDVVYANHQGQEVMPNLNRLAKRSLVWKNSYAHSTHSDYADPCIVSSLYPLRTRNHHYYTATDPWPKKLSYDCLKQFGYATATISSQNEMWSGMEYFLDSPSLDLFYHPERATDGAFAEVSEKDLGFHQLLQSGLLKAGKFSDRHTTDVAIDWINNSIEIEQPFLLNMNLQSSHFPYLIPTEASQPFQPCQIPSDASFAWYDPADTHLIRNAYFNALHEIDSQLGRLIQALKDCDRFDNTILVVLGENGESFHENGQVCHANKPYEPAIHIATVMHGPRWLGEGEEDYPIEHVDILPTLFGRIGIKSHPNFQGIDALAPDRPDLKDRFLFCHTHSPISEVDSLQWAGRWKYLQDRQVDQAELYDLSADPNETNNLIDQLPELSSALGKQLEMWRSRQLAWYHYPQLYENYFPPSAPTPDQRLEKVLNRFWSRSKSE